MTAGSRPVTVAAISLTQQVHTAQYVDTMSKNVSLTLTTQEAIDRKLEMRVDALEEAIVKVGKAIWIILFLLKSLTVCIQAKLDHFPLLIIEIFLSLQKPKEMFGLWCILLVI